jgi:hypothetical protein
MDKHNNTMDSITKYLNDMAFIWLNMLLDMNNNRENSDKLNVFSSIFEISDSLTPENKTSLENIRLITMILTLRKNNQTNVCDLIVPNGFEGDNKTIIDTFINSIRGEIQPYLDNCDTIPKSTSAGRSMLLKMLYDFNRIRINIDNVVIRNSETLQIYVLSIISSVLFDVSEFYFPMDSNTLTTKITLLLRGVNLGSSTPEKQPQVNINITNSQIFSKINDVILVILALIQTPLECNEEINNKIPSLQECEESKQKGITLPNCPVMGGKKSKKMRKKLKNLKKTIKR